MSAGSDIFSTHGFYTRIVPRIAIVCVVMALIVFVGSDLSRLSLLSPGNLAGLAMMAVMSFFILVIMPIARYRRARQKHEDFIARYGKSYLDLIDSGAVILNSFSVLMAGAPERHEKLISEASRRSE